MPTKDTGIPIARDPMIDMTAQCISTLVHTVRGCFIELEEYMQRVQQCVQPGVKRIFGGGTFFVNALEGPGARAPMAEMAAQRFLTYYFIFPVFRPTSSFSISYTKFVVNTRACS